MVDGLELDAGVLQELEKQVDLLTSQRDILTRVERLLTRLIEIQAPASNTPEANQETVESFFSKDR